MQQIQAGSADLSLDVTAPPLPVVRQLQQAKDPNIDASLGAALKLVHDGFRRDPRPPIWQA